MTDRYNSLTVVLERDMRSDDAEALITAIMQLRGVIGVEPNVSDSLSTVAEVRARHDLSTKLWKVLYPNQEKWTW